MATPKTVDVMQRLRSLITAAHEELDPKKPVVLNGTRYTLAAIVAALQRHIDAQAAVRDCEWALKQARADRAKAAKAADLVSRGLEAYLRVTLGPSSPLLQPYGVKPRKKRNVPVETKAASAEKARATRKARGTTGRKQR
jgi:hypothetical protein